MWNTVNINSNTNDESFVSTLLLNWSRLVAEEEKRIYLGNLLSWAKGDCLIITSGNKPEKVIFRSLIAETKISIEKEIKSIKAYIQKALSSQSYFFSECRPNLSEPLFILPLVFRGQSIGTFILINPKVDRELLLRTTSQLGPLLAADLLVDNIPNPVEDKMGDLAVFNEGLTDVFWIADLNLNIKYISKSVAQIFGYSSEERAKFPIQKVITPASLEKIRMLIAERKLVYQQTKDSISPITTVLEGIHRDGSTVSFEVNVNFITNNGKITGLKGVSRNVTQRIKMLEALNESEKLFKNIFYHSYIGMIISDLEGNFIRVNQAFCNMIDYTSEQLSGMNFRKITHPEDLDPDLDYLNDLLAGNTNSFCMEKRYFTSTGKLLWVNINVSLIRSENQHPLFLIGQIQNITEKKEAIDKIRRQKELLSATFDNLQEGIGLLDAVDTIQYCNPAYAEIFEESQESMVGKKIIDYFESDQCRIIEKQNKLRRNNIKSNYVLKLSTKNGQLKYLKVYVSPYFVGDLFSGSFGSIVDITPQMTFEKALFESEQKFKVAFKTSPDAVNITRRKDGIYLDINEGFTKITGYTEEDVIGKSSTDLNIWDSADDRKRLVDALKKNGKVENLEAVFRKKDGGKIIGLMSASVIKLGNEPCLISITRDITERKRSENEVAASRAYLKSMLDNIEEAFLLIDCNANIIAHNKPAEKISQKLFNLKLRTRPKFAPKTDTRKVTEIVIKHYIKATTGKRTKHELLLRHDPPEHYEIIYHPIPPESGVKAHTVALVIRDISAQIKYQQEINQLNFRLNFALEIGRVAWWELDYKTNELKYSDKISDFLGYSNNFLKNIGQLKKLMHPDDLHSALAKFHDYIKTEKDFFEIEFRLRHKDGSYRWFYDRGVVIKHDRMGNPTYIAGAVINIDLQKQDQMLINEKNERLIKTNSELDNFVYRVSHDLRAPIASALGLINISKNETSKTIVDTYLDLQDKSLRKLDHFIKDIIDYSRNSRLDVKAESIDFKTELESTLAQFSFMDNYTNLEKIIDVDQKQPFLSDTRRINVIFNNLVSNAIRYQNQYLKNSWLRITVKCSSSKACIDFSDNGIGIESQYVQRIFDMFFRATAVKSGSGLGLYIVKETIESLKGSISVESAPMQGTTFRIIIPNLQFKEGEAI